MPFPPERYDNTCPTWAIQCAPYCGAWWVQSRMGYKYLRALRGHMNRHEKRSNYVTSFRRGELRETKADASIAKARWLQAKCAIIETRAIMGQCTWRKHSMRYGDWSCEKSKHRVFLLARYLSSIERRNHIKRGCSEYLVKTWWEHWAHCTTSSPGAYLEEIFI